MSEIINLEDEFNSWFNEIEMYCLRSERFYEELPSMTSHQMLEWLKAAYIHGVKTAAQNSVDTLRDYNVAMQGVKGAIPIEIIFDHVANNLNYYWEDILKDKE